uniref:SFRICE042072.2 n=1 Tax=Spodoptera frugiperda TaxID=7108 RepID=A0A2H1X129_SPOFR
MAKVTYILLFLVAVSLSSVQTDESQSSTEVDADVDKVIDECAKEYHVPHQLLMAAVTTASVHALTPCFWSCCFKGVGVLNSDGQYDIDATLDLSKKMFSGSEYQKVEGIVKSCGSVNDISVSDGKAGCEISVSLAVCILDNCKKIFPNMFHD